MCKFFIISSEDSHEETTSGGDQQGEQNKDETIISHSPINSCMIIKWNGE